MTILILTTGGSIDKQYSTRQSAFVVGEPQAAALLAQANARLPVQVKQLLARDSLEITTADRQQIVAAVQNSVATRIIITHGTDTMLDTGRALMGIAGKTIVLTGAMQPAAFKNSDAPLNFGGALVAIQILPPGVYVVMNGRVFDPTRARKNVELDCFEDLD